eukprot:m51a1_g472 hypothetical protein (125) ;mRNA; f:190920-192806
MGWARLALTAASVLAWACVAQCDGEGSEIYDAPPYSFFGVLVPNENPRVCGDEGEYSSPGMAQIFTPRSFPWMFTRVCFLTGVSDDSPRNSSLLVGEIGTYEVVADYQKSKLSVGDRLPDILHW